ncbi:transposase [Clostridium chromiireducens]|uniref:transposase n=1 Tax=Clostridium chromiireducens TaxID=225345 RepID=UPI003AF79B8D
MIKQKLNCSDRETVSAIAENPYLQYFIGLKELQNSAPFGASSMVESRKRIDDDMIIEMNNTILKDTTKYNDNKDNHDDNDGGNNSDQSNQGTIIIDATCTPADITYPQDLNLLNSAREKLEGYINLLHNPSESKI